MNEIWNNDYLHAVLVSLLCGTIVGIEREYKNKSAGLRTLVLICFGATTFTLASKMGDMSDDRIAANIVTGIGFLGAGVIYQGKFSVQGLTTAAVIWAMAAVGVFVGFGQYSLGIALSVAMVLVLSLFQHVENWLSDIYLTKIIYVTMVNDEIQNLYAFQEFLIANNVSFVRKGIEKENDRVSIKYEIASNRNKMRQINEQIIGLKYVYSFSNIEIK